MVKMHWVWPSLFMNLQADEMDKSVPDMLPEILCVIMKWVQQDLEPLKRRKKIKK